MCLLGAKRAFLDRDGFSEVVWKGKNGEPRISIYLTAEASLGQTGEQKVYDYEISFLGSPSGAFIIDKEVLTVQSADTPVALIELQSGRGQLCHLDGTQAVRTPIDADKSALELDIPGWEGTEFRKWLSSWHFYRLVPALMKRHNDARVQYALSSTGDNLSAWLLTLQTSHQEQFKRIKQVALDTFPSLEEILTPPTQIGTTFLSTREKELGRPITVWRMSDGELVFLALLSLIFSPSELGSPLVCVEEPENHLHPKLIETLIEVYTQRRTELGSQAAQLFVTTHSPYVIDKLNIEDLLVSQKVNAETVLTRPASKSHLRELLEHEEVGLGDLWYSGALSEP
jgi:predicted ATPase